MCRIQEDETLPAISGTPSLGPSSWSSILYATMGLDSHDGDVSISILKTVAQDIVEGRLGLGQEVNSVELARRFGTSRTPVREALLRLEAGGLVTVPARQRPSVWRPTLAQAHEIYELRAGLDAMVGELVAKRATEDDIARLWHWQNLREEDCARGDSLSYFWHNVAGRNDEARIAGNAELERVITQLGLRVLVLRRISLSTPSRMAESVAMYRRLVQAYEDRDERSAATVARLITMDCYRAVERLAVLPTTASA